MPPNVSIVFTSRQRRRVKVKMVAAYYNMIPLISQEFRMRNSKKTCLIKQRKILCGVHSNKEKNKSTELVFCLFVISVQPVITIYGDKFQTLPLQKGKTSDA